MTGRPINNRAWLFVLPVLAFVLFSSIIPVMTVVNYSIQELDGGEQFLLERRRMVSRPSGSKHRNRRAIRRGAVSYARLLPHMPHDRSAAWHRHRAKLAQVWWQNVSKAVSGEATPQQAMDGVARDQDAIMTRLEKSGAQGKLGPKMNEERDPEYWYARAEKDGNLSPQRKLANEKPPGETVDYDELLKTWTQTA